MDITKIITNGIKSNYKTEQARLTRKSDIWYSYYIRSVEPSDPESIKNCYDRMERALNELHGAFNLASLLLQYYDDSITGAELSETLGYREAVECMVANLEMVKESQKWLNY